MAWDKTKPAAGSTMAASNPELLANLSCIEGVLGADTLSAGIAVVSGDILYGTATAKIGRLAKGTANQVLTMNSGATAPEWAGGLKLIATNSPSADTTSSFTSLSTSTRYKVIVNVLQNTNDAYYYIRFNSDTGSNYYYSSCDTRNVGENYDGVSTGASASIPLQAPTGVLVDDGDPFFAEFSFVTIPGDNTIVQVLGDCTFWTGIGVISVSRFGGYYNGASNLTSILIGTSAGTMTGTITLYQMS